MKFAHIFGPALATLVVGLCAPASASPSHSLAVTAAWSRPAPAGLQTGVVYMIIVNPTSTPDRLVDASTPVATRMELHRSTMVRGLMSMASVQGGLPIPAGGRIEIAPNGYHFMLLGLTRGLAVGSSFPATLHFAHAGRIRVEVEVLAAAPEMAAMPGMR
jgi:copper(I)-binding protein